MSKTVVTPFDLERTALRIAHSGQERHTSKYKVYQRRTGIWHRGGSTCTHLGT